MTTFLVTGGAGFLGNAILTLAHQLNMLNMHATYVHAVPVPLPHITFHVCDLRNPEAVGSLIQTAQPEVIIHTACSDHSSTSEASILPAAQHLATVAAQYDIRLLHLSSDMVFSGEHAPYFEDSHLDPITRYGQYKAEAEQLIQSTLSNALIIRPSLIYGVDPPDRQSRWLLKAVTNRTPLKLFTDEIRCPIWVNTLARAILELAQSETTGILHLAGPQALSRWDIGQHLLALHHQRFPAWIQRSTVADSGLTRPRDLTLSVDKARTLLRTPLLSFQEVHDSLNAN